MPLPVPPDPTPIIPPSYNASGIVSTSGPTLGLYPGPWFVEEQSMDISYHRVPAGSLSSFDISLSSNSVTERNVETMLVCEIKASYTSQKDWTNYSTSAWTQPQKFEFLSFSADTQGRTYGALTPSTLGPMGDIITKQPYYNRRLWSDLSGDTTVTKQITAANYYALQYPFTSFSSTVDQTQYNDKFEHWWIPADSEGSLIGMWATSVWSMGSYIIPGVYATSQENIWKIFRLIDNLGDRVRGEGLFAIPATMAQYHVESDQGFPEYKINRHDYS